ncbi:MAG: acyltransferase [Pseudomonadota bacterium]
MQRDPGIDHVRILLTVLVILHHIAIVYGGAGDWYWIQADEAKLHLIAFNTVNQSFFMGFFFLISGYFSQASIEGKGPKRFLRDRLIRLGIPLAVYFLFISPFTIALASTEGYETIFADQAKLMRALVFEPGPMWFVMALLLFSLPLCALHAWRPKLIVGISKTPSAPALAAILLLVGLLTFLLRQITPVGETYFWFQLGYFPMYVVLFALGVHAHSKRLLSRVSAKSLTCWLPISIALVLALPVLLALGPDREAFLGGMNPYALMYALWEPFTATGIILSLLYLLVVRLNQPNTVMAFLSPLVYSIYIIHPPVVVAVSRLLSTSDLGYPVTMLGNATLSVCLCVLFSWLLLKVPYVARVL